MFAYYFKKELEGYKPGDDPDCDCPPDCEFVAYSVETSTLPLDPVDFCVRDTDSDYFTPLAEFIAVREREMPGQR